MSRPLALPWFWKNCFTSLCSSCCVILIPLKNNSSQNQICECENECTCMSEDSFVGWILGTGLGLTYCSLGCFKLKFEWSVLLV